MRVKLLIGEGLIAGYASRLEEAAVHVEDAVGACAFVEVVYVPAAFRTFADERPMRLRVPCSRRCLLYGIAIAGLSFASCTAFGQADQESLTSLSIEELSKVKVFSASRHLEDSRDAPSAVSVITADEISRYGWRTLGEALRSLRGFYTAYDRNYTSLGVRGFLRSGDYNSRVLLMVNGHRMNDNIYGSAAIGTEFPLDLDLVDRIEVVRGPSSSLYGANAVFGVINVITRPARSKLALEISSDISSFYSRTGRATTSFERGNLSVLLSGSMYLSAGPARLFFPEMSAPVTNNGVAQNLDGDRYAHAFADVRYGHWRVDALLGSRRKIVPTASFGTNFNDPGTRTTDSRGYLDLSYHRSFSSATDVDVRTYFDSYDYHGTYAYGGTNSPGRYLNYDKGSSTWAGMEATVGRPIGKHRITAGAAFEHYFSVDQLNYDIGGSLHVNDHRTPSIAALYTEAELKLLPQVTVRAGGRLDYFDAYGASLSPRFALIYSPNSRTSVKYIFGRAFRPPNAYESYYSDSITQSANPNLRSENIQSNELVLERQLTPWLQSTAELFHSDLHNLIDPKSDPATGFTHFINNGHDHSRGAALELQAKRTSGMTARASYSLTDTRDEIEKERLINAPLHMAKLNLSVPISLPAFASVELLYSGAETSYQATRVPSSFLTNFTSSTKPIWGGWEFSASLYNAFDHREFSPGGAEHVQSAIPQDGRTFRFKVSFRFAPPEARPAQ